MVGASTAVGLLHGLQDGDERLTEDCADRRLTHRTLVVAHPPSAEADDAAATAAAAAQQALAAAAGDGRVLGDVWGGGPLDSGDILSVVP